MSTYNEAVELEFEEGAKLGDPRRCPRHPEAATSSPDGMFDTECNLCEAEMDMGAMGEGDPNRYVKRPVAEVTTEDLIATIQNDHNDVATFEARHAFRARTRDDWRVFAPVKPRTWVDGPDGRIMWHNFVETGWI